MAPTRRRRPGARDPAGGTAAAGSGTRLDQPRRRGAAAARRATRRRSAGSSERIARFLGTGRFIVWMTRRHHRLGRCGTSSRPRDLRFDPYPFIFLTLMLSLQASYAAPLILLAQNRQDDRDRVNLRAGPQRRTSGRSPTPST